MTQVLSISYRPKTLSQMIGVEKVARQVRGLMSSGREPKAWMFFGPTGSGKTTIARILSVALQCEHQEEFGNPCKECRRLVNKFDIVELNNSQLTTKEDITQATRGVNYRPRPGNKRRVYILDEAQGLSEASQRSLLKPFEDCPATTVWIICTTEPEKILPTLRSRCMSYEMPQFGIDDIKTLVDKAIKKVGGKRDAQDLAEALLSANVRSPRLIVNSVEKYLSDESCSADDAAKSEVVAANVTFLTRALMKGNWSGIAQQLRDVSPSQAVGIRIGVTNYLQVSLLNEIDRTPRAVGFTKAIKVLISLQNSEYSTQLAGLAAILCDLCALFKKQSM